MNKSIEQQVMSSAYKMTPSAKTIEDADPQTRV